MPENWKKYNLGDLSEDISYGYTESASKIEIGPKFLRITDIQNDFIDWNEVPYCKISEKDLIKYQVEIGDIVVARTGNSTGATSIVKNEINAVYASYLIRYRLNKKIAVPGFIDFVLRSNSWKNYVDAVKGGSAQPGANAKQFAAFEINLPPLQEQKSIASILSALDDKIELNLQMNKTLEEMAMVLYKHWFVDFGPFQDGEFVDSELGEIPKEWEVKRMEDIISVKDGTHDSPKRKEEGYYLITSKHIKTNEIDFSTSYKISEKDYHKINQRSKVDKDDILMTMIGTVGLFHLVNNEPNYAIKNIGLFKTSEKKEMKNFMFLFFKSQYSTQYIQSQLAGSTQQYLTLKVLRAFPVLQPPEKELLNFNLQIKEFLKLIEGNICENQTLTQLRDTLLPKLISGEVRVKDVEKTLTEVL